MAKRMIFDKDYCVLDLYRILIYPKNYHLLFQKNSALLESGGTSRSPSVLVTFDKNGEALVVPANSGLACYLPQESLNKNAKDDSQNSLEFN